MSSKRAGDPPRVPIITTAGTLARALMQLPPDALVFLRAASDKEQKTPPPPTVILEQEVYRTPGGSIRGAEITLWLKTRPSTPLPFEESSGLDVDDSDEDTLFSFD